MILAAPSPTPETWQTVDPDVLESLSEEITTLSAHLHAETYRLLKLIAEFDRLEGWRREGFGSCAEWLAYATRLDKMTAREKVRVARALAGLPETSAAMAKGELSFSQVRALTRVAEAESEEELLEHARSMSAAALERLVRSWKGMGREDEAERERRLHGSRCFSVFPDEEGMYLVRGRLDPEVGALLMRAIEAASDALYRGSVPETTPEQRRADALGSLAERALAAGLASAEPEAEVDSGGRADVDPSGTPADRYLVVVHVDEVVRRDEGPSSDTRDDSTRSHLEDGTRVSAETSRRIACDASVVRVVSADGRLSPAVGAKTRMVPPRMRRALQIRDGGCRFPGCGSRFTDAHHIQHWADGGPTRPDNLVLLCRTHHRLLHEGGFRLEPDPQRPGRPTFYAPKNVRIPEIPPKMRLNGAARRADSVDALTRPETREAASRESAPTAMGERHAARRLPARGRRRHLRRSLEGMATRLGLGSAKPSTESPTLILVVRSVEP